MYRVLDNSLVALALLASAGYALAALGPKGLRRQLYATLARFIARAPKFLRLDRLARRLDAASAGASAGCGGCSSCGSEASSADKPAAPGAPEVRVPLEKIARRT
jgi:hypothetical protein